MCRRYGIENRLIIAKLERQTAVVNGAKRYCAKAEKGSIIVKI